MIKWNKRGEGYIFPCVMIVILCMIMSVLIYFLCTASMIRSMKHNSEVVFDSYITKNAIEIYDSVKQGNDYTESIDSTEYVTDLCRFCTLEKRSILLYNYDSNGKVKFYMTTPRISFVESKTLKIRVSYTMYVPIYFNGTRITTAIIPIEIKSSFMERY